MSSDEVANVPAVPAAEGAEGGCEPSQLHSNTPHPNPVLHSCCFVDFVAENWQQ